jgi:tetratricopeptide (TPR) repeat protein
MHLLAATVLLAALAGVPTSARAPASDGARGATQRVASPRAYAHYLRARVAEAAGDLRTAVEEMRSAVVFDPGSASLHVALAELLARTGQIGRAESEARRAASLAPEGPAAWEAHLLLGKAAVLDRRPGDAIRELRRSIELQVAQAGKVPAEDAVLEPEAWRLLAQVRLEGGDEAAAERVLDELGARRPADGAAAIRELGMYHLEKGRTVRAEALFRKAVALERRDVESWRQLARLAEKADRPDDARRAWEDLLREDDDDPEALLALGRLALGAGDASAARAWFDRLLNVSRDEAAARSAAAFAWLDAHRPGEALAIVDSGLRTGSEPRLHYLRGLALQDLRRYGDAADAFGAVATDDAELDAAARAARVGVLVQAGRVEEAEKAVDAALAAHPGDARLQAARAFVLERTGRSAEAVAYLGAALRKAGPGKAPSSLYEALANAQEKSGDPDGAVRTMQSLLARDPDDADAMNYVAYTWAEKGVRLDEAEKLVTRALALRPGNAFFLDTLGWVHFRKGEYARAVAVLEQAERKAGAEATILEHLGDAYGKARRPRDAARAYQRALEALADGAIPEPPEQKTLIENKLRALPGAEPTTSQAVSQ